MLAIKGYFRYHGKSAGMVELVDTRDLKSLGCISCASSSLVSGKKKGLSNWEATEKGLQF